MHGAYACRQLFANGIAELRWLRTGTVALDAHTAILTLCVFLFISFPFGVATAATIRVGNLLGGGRPQQARIAGAMLSGCTASLTQLAAVAHRQVSAGLWLTGVRDRDDYAQGHLSACEGCRPHGGLCTLVGGPSGTAGVQHGRASLHLSARPGYVCVAIGTSFLTVAGVAIYVFRDSLGYLFVSSAKVAAMVATICPIAALYQFPDGILGTIGGILRCGHAVVVAAEGRPSCHLPLIATEVATSTQVRSSSPI